MPRICGGLRTERKLTTARAIPVQARKLVASNGT
jgi:hypothetical protein